MGFGRELPRLGHPARAEARNGAVFLEVLRNESASGCFRHAQHLKRRIAGDQRLRARVRQGKHETRSIDPRFARH